MTEQMSQMRAESARSRENDRDRQAELQKDQEGFGLDEQEK